ncbi:FAD dependent oxidoreductase [Pyronema omphalodes]|nr:FAD dependent oxidoreductase [Pyronema omphalodes]
MAESVAPKNMIVPPLQDPGLPKPRSTASFWHSPPNSFLHAHRSTELLPTVAETVIIGSGIAGSMMFHNLHSLGLSNSTVMLEARNTCWGATGRNGGHCKPMLYQANELLDMCQIFGSDETIKRIRFEMLNFELIKSYVETEKVDCEWVETPSADVFYEPAPFQVAKKSIEALTKLAPDISAQLRIVEDPKELSEDLRTPTAVGAVVFKAGKLSPYKLVSHILTKGIKTQGLNLQTRTPATGVSRNESGTWTITTPRGCITANKVIFATNAHTSHLLPQFRGWIYPVRAQISALIPPKSLKERPLTHSYGLVRHSRKTACYLIQRPINPDGTGGELMLGGGREFEHNQGVSLQDDGINQAVAQKLRSSIAEYFAGETGYRYPVTEEIHQEKEDNNRDLRKSFIEKFRRLKLGGTGYDVWDAAEGTGFFFDNRPLDVEKQVRELQQKEKEKEKDRDCKPKMEWSGTMGFSKDGRPFVGKVPPVLEEDAKRLDIPEMASTKGLWMLAGFEGHGMAFTSGSAKALAEMIAASNENKKAEGVNEWFPQTFVVTASRMGLMVDDQDEDEGWEELVTEEWEIVDKSEGTEAVGVSK